MLSLNVEHQNGEVVDSTLKTPFIIGRQSPAQLVLKGWRVAKTHAKIIRNGDDYFINDMGSLTGTVVNTARVTEYGPLLVGDCILIGPCKITVLRLGLAKGIDTVKDSISSLTLSERMPGDDAYLGASCRAIESTTTQQAQEFDPFAEHIAPLHQKLVSALDLRRKNYRLDAIDSLRAQAELCLAELIEIDSELDSNLCKVTLSKRVLDEALGLGPLEELLRDDSVSEIMVNSPSEVFVERHGLCVRSALQFSSELALLAVIDRIVSPLGRRIDDSSPMVDARLPDGSRVNAVVSPIALKGPTLTVRKFPRHRLSSADLLSKGAFSECMALFLQRCVEYKKNIVVSGGTGSGKTTLLNVLTHFIAPSERIITIEDAAELKLDHANVVTLEARPANIEGQGLISIRDLVRNALRMRPDRIVVGECRGGEAFDMLAAMNTGHEGSLTTLHANSPREAMNRLETLVMLAGMDLPINVVRDHIASSLNIIVQQSRLSSGRRVISSITEICGLEGERIQLQELFHAKELEDGSVEFNGNGLFPQNFDAQRAQLNSEWFSSSWRSYSGS